MDVCVDAGPIIHLEEIDRREPWRLFADLRVPEPVADEIRLRPKTPGGELLERGRFVVVPVDGGGRMEATRLAMEHEVSFADGTVLALAERTGVQLVATDDLDLRDAAKVEGVQPVGSLGLILRATYEGLVSIEEALGDLDQLLEASSLFLTPALVERAKDALRRQ